MYAGFPLSPCAVIGASVDGGMAVTGVPSSDNELLVQAVPLHSPSTPAASLSRLWNTENPSDGHKLRFYHLEN